MRAELAPLFASSYAAVKSQNPTEGRRKWHLRILEQFWASGSYPAASTVPQDAEFDDDENDDDDAFDDIIADSAAGVLIRTDFLDDTAWQEFSAKFDKFRAEFKADNAGPSEAVDAEMGSDSGSEDEPELIKIVNPSSPKQQALLKDISNLTALRLFNDIDIRPSPAPPAGTKRVSPPNRLVDHHGWQEIYTGRTIWIYDAASNQDACVRLVGQEGDVYGTATGDSWRAQVSHIHELQFNMVFLGMKINFGGLDRWDYAERKRNLEEAEKLS